MLVDFATVREWTVWCITATTFSVFHVAATRSREVLEKLVGTEFAGYLNLDYFSANCSFAWNYWIKAQLPRNSTGSLHLRYLAPRLVSVKISLVLSEAVLVLLLDRRIPSTSTIASD